jgi:hypothetical protein
MSVHDGALQMPELQIPLEQSVLILQAFPLLQAAQSPPQSTSVSVPSFLPLPFVSSGLPSIGFVPDEPPEEDAAPLLLPPFGPTQFEVQFGSIEEPSSVVTVDVAVQAVARATANTERTRATTG